MKKYMKEIVNRFYLNLFLFYIYIFIIYCKN
jgi:hypothetical protein